MPRRVPFPPRRLSLLRVCGLLLVFLGVFGLRAADFVIVISADGVGSAWLQDALDAGRLPHFRRLQQESAWTFNARCDPAISTTLPNHVDMITGRPVLGPRGHAWRHNTDPPAGVTLHSNRGSYVASVFDVVHEAGRRSGLWASKTKFSLFQVSYGPFAAGADASGDPLRIRQVLDVYMYEKSSLHLVRKFLTAWTQQPYAFAFLHLTDCDTAGHTYGWGSPEYEVALQTVDQCLGEILEAVTVHPERCGHTTLIVTADHGGENRDHGEATRPRICTIPFFVWGADVTPGDLYAMNDGRRASPELGCPDDPVGPPPIRNGEIANLALSLLGLGPVPGSVYNAAQDLRVTFRREGTEAIWPAAAPAFGAPIR